YNRKFSCPSLQLSLRLGQCPGHFFNQILTQTSASSIPQLRHEQVLIFSVSTNSVCAPSIFPLVAPDGSRPAAYSTYDSIPTCYPGEHQLGQRPRPFFQILPRPSLGMWFQRPGARNGGLGPFFCEDWMKTSPWLCQDLDVILRHRTGN